MALKLGDLQVDIGADTKDLKRADKEVKRTADNMGKAFSRLGGIIAAALSFQAVKSTILLADKMNMLDQKIKNVSKSAKQFQTVRQGIRDIAKETGASIESISTLSQQLLIAGESIGATSDQIVTMTSNLNKLGAIGGSSGEQMGNAMLQFGQAMAGGVVRAEEFNSIVENTPVIAQSIAKGMGMTVGELRKAVNAGTVLSEDVFAALEGQTDSINTKFAKMPLTVDRASGMIANSFAVAVQEIDQGLDVTEAIAEAMKTVSEVIASDLVPFVDDLVLSFKEMAILWDGITQSSEKTTDETLAWDAALSAVKESLKFIWNAIVNIPANLRDITTILVGEFSQAWTKVGASFNVFTEVLKISLINAVGGALVTVRQKFNEFIGGAQVLLGDLFDAVGADEIGASLKATGEEAIAFGDELNAAFEEQKQVRLDQLAEELAAIENAAAVKVQASQMAIDWGLAETEALKKQTKERIEVLRKEMKAKRTSGQDEVKSATEVTKVKKTEKDKQNDNLKDAQTTANALEQAGLVDSRTAALVQIGISAAQAIAKSMEVGFPAAIPFVAQAIAGIASAKSQLTGAGRSHGGSASGGMPIPINERGSPEMFINNAGRQFLLPDQSGKVVPLSGGSGGGGSGGLNVVINNNSDAVVSDPVVTEGQLMIEINRAVETAVNQVNSSLASQRGETAEALRQGFAQNRNI